MVRVKRGVIARTRRKKLFVMRKGRRGANSILFRIAQQQRMKSINYSYRRRRERKRQYRLLWVRRLNVRVQIYGFKYSSVIDILRKKKYLLNRKILSQLSIYDLLTFHTLIYKDFKLLYLIYEICSIR